MTTCKIIWTPTTKEPKTCHALATTSHPSECGQQHTLISVNAQTVAWQQSIGNSEATMSKKCGEWRDQFITTLSPTHWVSVQDKGSVQDKVSHSTPKYP